MARKVKRLHRNLDDSVEESVVTGDNTHNDDNIKERDSRTNEKGRKET